MKVVIAHLFYDLLNLYGESGNVLALTSALKKQNVDVEIKNLSLDTNNWILDDVDIFYIGAGTENNQILALNKLKDYTDEIRQHISNGKFFIATGNSIELFGQNINNEDATIETLHIFDYTTDRTAKRLVSECVFNYDEINDKILGFQNHQGIITGITSPLFTTEKGFGSNTKANVEGIRQNNFYGTYLIGPLLVRNPKMLEKLCKEIILSKDSNFNFLPFNSEIEQKAHDEFLNKYDNVK